MVLFNDGTYLRRGTNGFESSLSNGSLCGHSQESRKEVDRSKGTPDAGYLPLTTVEPVAVVVMVASDLTLVTTEVGERGGGGPVGVHKPPTKTKRGLTSTETLARTGKGRPAWSRCFFFPCTNTTLTLGSDLAYYRHTPVGRHLSSPGTSGIYQNPSEGKAKK